jgi:hypothetical protein
METPIGEPIEGYSNNPNAIPIRKNAAITINRRVLGILFTFAQYCSVVKPDE